MTVRTYDPLDVTISVEGEPVILHAVAREALARLKIVLSRSIPASMLGIDFGPSIMDGDRGCFHDGCDAAVAQEGGSHWCKLVRWGPLVPLVPPPTPATPG